MHMTIVHCVVFDGPVSGWTGWFRTPRGADEDFDRAAADASYDEHFLTRFDVLVPADASDDEIGDIAGDAAWNHDFLPLRHRLPIARPEPEPADAEMSPEQLDDKYNPGGDGEHPQHTRAAWRSAVAQQETISGYWQWVSHRLTM